MDYSNDTPPSGTKVFFILIFLAFVAGFIYQEYHIEPEIQMQGAIVLYHN